MYGGTIYKEVADAAARSVRRDLRRMTLPLWLGVLLCAGVLVSVALTGWNPSWPIRILIIASAAAFLI